MPRRRRKRKRASLTQTMCCLEAKPTPRRVVQLPEHLATDQLIRQLGFRIYQRATGKLTLWYKNGSTYSQQEILERYVSEEEIWEIEYRQMMEEYLDLDESGGVIP